MLRPPQAADRDVVLAWRNHPQVRAVSLNQHEIAPAEHRAWWDAVQADPTRAVRVYEHDGTASGVVTFFDLDEADGSGWWGYYLDVDGVDERGHTLLAWIAIQREAVRYAFEDLGLQTLRAEVLGDNASVRSLNRRQGFREVSSDWRELGGQRQEVFVIELTAADWRAKQAARTAKQTTDQGSDHAGQVATSAAGER